MYLWTYLSLNSVAGSVVVASSRARSAIRQPVALRRKVFGVTFHNVHLGVPVSVPGVVTGPVITVT